MKGRHCGYSFREVGEAGIKIRRGLTAVKMIIAGTWNVCGGKGGGLAVWRFGDIGSALKVHSFAIRLSG